jgi:GNAT superfamily N-acetyltransferase
MQVRLKRSGDQAWIDKVLADRWGPPGLVVARGELLDPRPLPAFIAGEREGLATFRIAADRSFAELVTLDALVPRRGVGTALVDALRAYLRGEGVPLLRVTTTNDNLDALRFYQRRGFRIVAVRPGVVDAARRLKPSIPAVGAYGIPLSDEIELERPT